MIILVINPGGLLLPTSFATHIPPSLGSPSLLERFGLGETKLCANSHNNQRE